MEVVSDELAVKRSRIVEAIDDHMEACQKWKSVKNGSIIT